MRQGIKRLVSLLFVMLALPSYLLYRLLCLIGDPTATFAAFSQLYSLLPGKIGVYLRVGFYRLACQDCHAEVVVSFGTLFSQPNIVLGSNVYIGPQGNIGACRIGQDTLLGSGVHILSGKGQHNFSELDVPIREQGGTFQQISIGKNCWIGNGAIVMAELGDNVIVAAGAVVHQDVAANSIVAGNPARVIRVRD